jgi:putative salt-induced outer membrane protein YdiY
MKKLTLSILCFLSALKADEVKTKNGSTVVGIITKVYKEKVYMTTPFAGNISIPLEEISSFTTDNEHNIEVENNEKLIGRVQYSTDATSLIRNEDAPLPIENLVTLWSKDDPHPDLKEAPISPWTHKAYLNINKQNGNTDKEYFSGGASTQWSENDEKLLIYGKFKQGTVTNQTTHKKTRSHKEYLAGLDYEYPFGPTRAHSLYLRSSYENDIIEGIDTRFIIASGYGYYFTKSRKTEFRARFGIAYRFENFTEDRDDAGVNHAPSNDESIGLDFGASYKQSLNEWGDWYSDLTYEPTFEDFNDYTIYHESGISIPFNVQEHMLLSLKTGVEHDYDSEAATDRENLDTTYFLRLAFKF